MGWIVPIITPKDIPVQFDPLYLFMVCIMFLIIVKGMELLQSQFSKNQD